MSEEFKADHFKNMEELLDTIKEWLINEELYGTLYDDFNRFFDTGAMEEMYYYIKQLQQKNQELNQKYLNAVADYEQEKFNVEELKKQLEECKDKINWYENFEINKTIDKLRIKHNNQQKEFIEYLENEMKEYYEVVEKGFYFEKYKCLKEILSKYKSIIGVSDEKEN